MGWGLSSLVMVGVVVVLTCFLGGGFLGSSLLCSDVDGFGFGWLLCRPGCTAV